MLLNMNPKLIDPCLVQCAGEGLVQRRLCKWVTVQKTGSKRTPLPMVYHFDCKEDANEPPGTFQAGEATLENACDKTAKCTDYPPWRGARMHVYIVDDDQDLATTMQILLKRHSHEVQTFSSASSFLEVMPSLPPGCILLDVRMPGMDGLSLRQELIQSGSPHEIILSSGAGEPPVTANADSVEFLAKPYRSKDLISLISQAEQRIKS